MEQTRLLMWKERDLWEIDKREERFDYDLSLWLFSIILIPILVLDTLHVVLLQYLICLKDLTDRLGQILPHLFGFILTQTADDVIWLLYLCFVHHWGWGQSSLLASRGQRGHVSWLEAHPLGLSLGARHPVHSRHGGTPQDPGGRENVILEVGGLHPGHREGDGRDPGAGQPVAARKLYFSHIKRVLVRNKGEALGGRVCLVRGEGEHVGNVLSDLVAIG